MKKLSKRRKVVFIVLTLNVVIIFFFLISWIIKSEAEKIALSCHNVYKKSMKLEYVSVDNDKDNIEIHFEVQCVSTEIMKNNMPEICQSIINAYFNEQDNQYEEYSIDIYFSDKRSGMGVTVLNMTRTIDSAEFWTTYMNFSIKEIAKLFPYISRLKLKVLLI